MSNKDLSETGIPPDRPARPGRWAGPTASAGRRAFFALCISCLGVGHAIAVEDASTRFFTAPARSLLDHAASFAGADTSSVICLYESVSYALDDGGKLSRVTLAVHRIRTPDGVSVIGQIREAWSPWHDNRPEVRARVISSDGEESMLDPRSLIEQRGAAGSMVEYSDARILMGPIPRVAVGSIVVYEVRRSEHRPYFEQGRVLRYQVGNAWPVLETHLEIRVPKTTPARFAVHGIAKAKPVRSESQGQSIWRLSVPALAPWPRQESWLVPDSSGRPEVQFSTARSWKEIAEGYRALLPAESKPPLEREELHRVLRADHSRVDSLTSLVELLHRRVRYTAVQLGIAGLVPKTATETIARGFGDCKDKGTVLVRLLEMCGFTADLALLSTGVGPDVDPDLPGMGQFDHAIVRVGGATPTWIDATAEHMRPGRLPMGVEGRRVLILTRGAEGLSRLPASTARANTVEERFDIRLSERGPARVHVSTRMEGLFEADIRMQIAEATSQDLTKYFQDDAKQRCGAGTIDSFHVARQSGLREPLTYGYHTSDGRHFTSNPDGASVAMSWRVALGRLESMMGADDGGGSPGGRPSRTSPFWVPIPCVTVVRQEVALPDGMMLYQSPPEQSIAMGPARLSLRHRSEAGRFTLELELDSGPRVWSPAEFDRYRRVSDSLSAEGPIALFFQVTGYRLQKAGRFQEAMAEFRRLARSHPKEALHREQLGDLFLEVGLGEQAREEARRGVELEPRNPQAHLQLGYVLLHSLLGEWMKDGADLVGARAALAKAAAMDSTDLLARKWLAVSLQYDADLVNRGPGAKLAESVEQLLYLRNKLEDRTLDGVLLENLAALGRFSAILDLTPPAESEDPDPRVMELIALAAKDGPPAAIRRAELKYRPERGRLLAAAAYGAMRLRRYADASALFDAVAAEVRESKELMDMRKKLRELMSLAPVPTSLSTPQAVMHRFAAWIGSGERKQLEALLAPDSPVKAELKEPETDLKFLFLRRVSEPMAIDFMRTVPVETQEDGARGWRVRLDGSDVGMPPITLYVVPRGSELALFSTEDDLPALGVQAIRLIERGQLAAARKWLDWARESVPDSSGTDPMSRLQWDWWLRNPGSNERHQLLSAAAALVAGRKDYTRRASILREERVRAAGDDERAAFDLHLVQALYEERDGKECETLLSSLLQRFPRSSGLKRLSAEYYRQRSMMEPARKILQQALAEDPNDRKALEELAELEAQIGDPASDWKQSFRRLMADGKTSRMNYNGYAWEWISRRAAPESAVVFARKACDPEDEADPAALHTLAMALAVNGDLVESKRVLGYELMRSARFVPGSEEWLVVGRIAQSLGETEAARAAYSRVERTPNAPEAANSVWALAQRELSSLPKADRGTP